MRKKILPVILLLGTSVSAFNCQANAVSKRNFYDKKIKPCRFLAFAEAEKILGQPVRLITNSWKSTDGKSRFDCAYRGIEKDRVSGRKINLFFTLEESPNIEESQKIYETIWQSNKNHAGIEVLKGIGDEAYSHSDEPNFHFVMVRKEKFTIRVKINKAVNTVSREELKTFVKRVTEQI